MNKQIIPVVILALCAAFPVFAQDIPIPKERPERLETNGTASTPEKQPEKEAVQKKAVSIAKEDPSDLKACLVALRAQGAVFKESEHFEDGNGCGIDKPVILSEPLPGISIRPEATVRCQTALQLSRWLKDSVLPAAEVTYGDDKLTGIENASDYVCRKRNNASKGKISEHARGNALDIGGFVFESGKRLDVIPRAEDSTLAGAFQRAIRATACLYFTTTLGPGSDSAHKTHFHLDILERNGGYRYCR